MVVGKYGCSRLYVYCLGMDRELAEEFIDQTMDPATHTGHTVSATESEAW